MQHALDAGDDDEFVPPEYEGEDLQLEPGFYCHQADYLHVLQGIPVRVFTCDLSASAVFTSALVRTLGGRLQTMHNPVASCHLSCATQAWIRVCMMSCVHVLSCVCVHVRGGRKTTRSMVTRSRSDTDELGAKGKGLGLERPGACLSDSSKRS
jgi:hypothetical protein